MTADVTALDAHLSHFRWRVIQDALAAATADYWERRALTFDWVAGDWTPGEPDPHGIFARSRDAARNCRSRAQLVRDIGLDAEAWAVINDVLSGVS